MDHDRGTEREEPLGAVFTGDGVRFAVWSSAAERMWVSVFDERFPGTERARHELARGPGNVFSATVRGLRPGARYGLRADGRYDPGAGFWFDPHKLLLDPYAVEIDEPWHYDPLMSAARAQGTDTASIVPKAVVRAPLRDIWPLPPLWTHGGLVYELSVRAFTRNHPGIAPQLRGTIRALAEPVVVDHLHRMNVAAVELMPVTAWIDERHLQALGLTNAWGYNPVSFMALDPRLAPGGLAELRETVSALHAAGIGVILDLVFNHTGESDRHGTTLSLRGIDNLAYFRHAPDGQLVNDTGTGNTLDADSPVVQRLVLDTLRHFVRHAGVDGFRFDLATIIGRCADGFDPQHPLLAAIETDPELRDRVLIAEPWDIGHGGYQLGKFSKYWLEWNDRYRDDVRRFWRGDAGTLGALATRLSGSSDVFGASSRSRSVNFIAAHDGMTLADVVAYARKHNEANGEDNRDGHDDNLSWNCGVEGPTDDRGVNYARRRDLRALLATLFASRGTPMLTAGDEFGRTQGGNNNAYCQDNAVTWLDWEGRDAELEGYVEELAALRADHPALRRTDWLEGRDLGDGVADVAWLRPDGHVMQPHDWEDTAARGLVMLLASETDAAIQLAVLINGWDGEAEYRLPDAAGAWQLRLASATTRPLGEGRFAIGARSVAFIERLREGGRSNTNRQRRKGSA